MALNCESPTEGRPVSEKKKNFCSWAARKFRLAPRARATQWLAELGEPPAARPSAAVEAANERGNWLGFFGGSGASARILARLFGFRTLRRPLADAGWQWPAGFGSGSAALNRASTSRRAAACSPACHSDAIPLAHSTLQSAQRTPASQPLTHSHTVSRCASAIELSVAHPSPLAHLAAVWLSAPPTYSNSSPIFPAIPRARASLAPHRRTSLFLPKLARSLADLDLSPVPSSSLLAINNDGRTNLPSLSSLHRDLWPAELQLPS